MVHWVILIVPAIIFIWLLSPVEAINKPLNTEERKHHKIVARSILFAEVIVVGLFVFNNAREFSYFSIVSVEIVAIQLIVGEIECKVFPSKQ